MRILLLENLHQNRTPSQSDQSDQGEEEEEIKEDKDFIIRKPASKNLKPLPVQFQYLSDAREVGKTVNEIFMISDNGMCQWSVSRGSSQ